MFSYIRSKIAAYFRYQETYRELSRLSARELRDLGISYSDIPYVAKRAAAGK